MQQLIIFLLIFTIGESLATFLFKALPINPGKKIKNINRSLIKGILERLFLFVALIYAIPQALIAFGALKIGTRFISDESSKISSDYFFIGNITSLLLVLAYFIIWKLLHN